ncbi:translesion error-prone DNA polymerase V autoproteolytic subunit [Candidatus Dojkabacteria bacterium]|uniref:Translesion error-prone DNA polymerase V autoproteolytic subunit n=1 Tax=Candidatus Dojkabacteria bacterium TaxID=2099670 RepID=A0A955LB55_9BACT|nr:translesion error-prone DNA polymerase V autoproteolytic subunit [Candidatus Dojkabacteria bacterium]
MKLQISIPNITSKVLIPVFSTSVSAGFPSPADDFIDRKLDLNEYLIKHPAASYFVKVNGESMKDVGINTGDLLLVDRSLDVKNGSIVIAAIDGEFTVKRVIKKDDGLYLVPENESYLPIKIDEEDEFQIFGVVKNVIKALI